MYTLLPDEPQQIGRVKRTVLGSAKNALNSIHGLLTPGEGRMPLPPGAAPIEPLSPRTNNKWGTQFAKGLGATEEQLEPQGIGEQIVQHAGSQIPAIALGGGLSGGARNIAKTLGTALLGSAASTVAKEAGLPEWAQTAAQIGTELGAGVIGHNRAAGKATGVKGKSGLTGHKEKIYEAARSHLAPREVAKASNLYEKMNKIVDSGLKGSSAGVKKIINDAANDIKSVMDPARKNIDISKAWDVKKAINAQIGSSATDKAAKSHLGKFVDGINEVFKAHSEKNPLFFKNYNAADRIHEAQNMSSFIGKYIKDKIPSTGLESVDKLLRASGALSAHHALGFKALAPLIPHYTHRAYQYMRVPEVRNYLFKLSKAAWDDNKTQVVKYGNGLIKAMRSSGEPDISEEQNHGGYRLLD